MESAIAALEAEVGELRSRVSLLEVGTPEAEPSSDVPAPPALSDLSILDVSSIRTLPALAGRSLIVLAGAFLLRALTEAGGVPMPVGIAGGMAYAILWLAAAVRASRSLRRTSAGFHAVCSAAVAFPLAWEATVRLEVLGPSSGAIVSAAFAGFGLLLAYRARLPVAAWVFALAGVATEVGLLAVARPGFLATAAVVGLAGAITGAPDEARWSPLHWLLTVVADVLVLRIVALAIAAGDPTRYVGPVDPAAAVALTLALPAVTLAAVLWRIRAGRAGVRVFDLLQVGIAAAIGFLGAISVARSSGHSTVWLGVSALVVAGVAFLVSYSNGRRAPQRRRAFLLLSSLGFACVIIGVPTLLGRSGAAVVWAGFAPISAFLGSRFDRISLRVHAFLYGLSATIAVGALIGSLHALLPAAVRPPGGSSTTSGLLVEAALVLAVVLMALDRHHLDRGPTARLPFTILVGVTAILVAGSSVEALASVLQLTGVPEAGALASSRTVMTAAVAMLLALLGRRQVLPEAAWLVYPLLALAMLELIVGDLAEGSARTLFLSFLVCGVALVVCPWLLRSRRGEGPEPPNAADPTP